MSGKKSNRITLLLIAFITFVSAVFPLSSVNMPDFKASSLISDINNWNAVGGSITETENGYELSRTDGNNFAISDKKASVFSFEADITILDGDRATLGYGFSNHKSPGSIWRGVELQKTGDTTGQVKAFIDLGPETISPVALSNMDWTQPNKLKIEMDSEKNLKVYVNGNMVGQGSDPTFESGYIGLVTWQTKAVFNNIKFTGSLPEGKTVSDIKNWTSVGGTITDGPEGYIMAENRFGDNFAISDKHTASFTVEADIKIISGEGMRATIAYGINSIENMGVWRGAEIMKTSDTTGQLKVFRAGEADVISPVALDNMDWTRPVKMKLIMDEGKKLTVYINNNKVAEGTDDNYFGGYIGLVSWKTKAIFNNIRYIGQAVESNFYTTLENLNGLNGSWSETEIGLRSSGSGDNFALSNTTATDFIFEAKVKFEQNKGAASLIFLSSDTPDKNSYCANVDLYAKNARIFKFGGGTLGEFKLPDNMQKSEYKLRVEVIGTIFNYYIDDVLVISCEDLSKKPDSSGRLGLLTFDTTIVYQDVKHKILTNDNMPQLKNINITGSDLKPSFDEKIYAYTAKIPYSADTIDVTPFASEEVTAKVKAYSMDGTPVTASDNNGTAKIPFTGDEIRIVIVAGKGDIELGYVIHASRELKPENLYKEKYRPQLHFSPLKNFMNDPNGLVFDPSNNTYHLFYQYNPLGLNIGNQVWGHAESTDLINWKQLDIAIKQDDGLGAIFSGCAVVDENNTSGLFTDNKPGESKLVAIFTHSGGDTSKGHEKQSLAYSKDHGRTWIKPSMEKEGFENPIISNENNKYGRDFRDPKVFWYDGKWFMVIAGGRARIFTSDNLINWTEVCDMGFDSECPDLFPLPVDGDSNNIKWVFTAAGDWYVIGRLEKDKVENGVQKYKFVSETDRMPFNVGPEVYATQTYFNDGSNKNRRIAISWMQDNTASQIGGDKAWNGAMTLPHELKIKTVNGKMILTSYPVEELNNLRKDIPKFEIKNKTVKANDFNILSDVTGQKFDIEAVITPGTATEFGFKLRKGVGQETIVKYNLKTNKFILDRSRSGQEMTGIHVMDMYPVPDGKVKMRIIVDTSIIEAFGNDGEAAVSVYMFSEPSSIGMEFFTNGTVTIDSLKIYDMKSIWHGTYDSEPKDPVIYLSVPDTNIATGKQVTINANVLPSTLSNKKLVWSVEDKSIFEIVSQSDKHITLKALKKGQSNITATLDGTSVENTITLVSFKSNFKTNLGEWRGNTGSWRETEDGLYTDGLGGRDAFAFFDVRKKAFVYEADVYPNANGGCPGLVFGAEDPYTPTTVTWFGANIDTFGNEAVAKLFQNTKGNEIWRITKSLPKSNGAYHLKVEVSEDGLVKYWVGDVLIGERKIDGYKEGYLGLVSWNSSGTFNNVMVKDPENKNPGGTQPPITSDNLGFVVLSVLLSLSSLIIMTLMMRKRRV